MLDSRRRGGLGGTEDAEAEGLEGIDDAEGERELGSDDGEGRLLGTDETHHVVEIFQIDWKAAGDLRDAAVARSAENLSNAWTAPDGPGERVFTASRSKDQYFHWSLTFSPTG